MIINAEEIKRAADIADIIGRRIPLKPARHGNHLEGSCPFHNSASGKSFHVTPEKNSWWCWGCRIGGNAVKFIMDYEHVDYPTALEIIASESRITVQYDHAPYTPGAPKQQVARQDILSVLDQVCSHYEENLRKPQNARALEYIMKRGFKEETLKKYRIGYAMGASVLTIGIDQEALVAAGVLKVSDTGNRYDPLEGRITIPIYDNAKHPVGFTGRLLTPSDNRPKYLNTADTAVFKKGRTLFGWYAAQKMLRSIFGEKKIYLIEGQLKAIALCEAGYPTIAAGGTGFTDQQAALISRLTDKAVIVPDPDEAGTAAAVSTARTLRKAEITVEIGELDRTDDPLAKDPDDLWAKGLPIRIDAMSLMTFLYSGISKGRCQTAAEATLVSKNIVPIILEHPLPAVRTIELRELSELSGIPESALATTPTATIQLPAQIQTQPQPQAQPLISLDLPPERLLVAVILQVGPAGNPDWLFSIPTIELPPMVGSALRELLWTFRYAFQNRLSICDALPLTVEPARLPWYQYWLQVDTNGELSTNRAIALSQEIIQDSRALSAMEAARQNKIELSQTIANWQ
ncbi:MAG: toprim domain-containing protein [Victivallales bacterium]|nr:toprim domain-containing protein [Victivallales bacterium]